MPSRKSEKFYTRGVKIARKPVFPRVDPEESTRREYAEPRQKREKVAVLRVGCDKAEREENTRVIKLSRQVIRKSPPETDIAVGDIKERKEQDTEENYAR